MCHPTKPEGARPVGVSRVVKSWSPFQMVRSINKKIITNGADLSKKIVRVTGKAKNKVVKVQRLVFNLTFAKVALPLCFFFFILLLHPHTEIQVGAVATFSLLFLSFLLLSSKFKSDDDLSSVNRDSPDVNLKPRVVCHSSDLALGLYSCLPLASISRGWGWLASVHLPQPLMTLVIRVFAEATGCDRSEAERDIQEYSSLSQWFTRRLRPGLRPISERSALVSPADGTITTSSTVSQDGFTHLVKGLSYSLEMFLGCLDNIRPVIKVNDDSDYDSDSPAQVLLYPAHSRLLLNSLNSSPTQLYETTIYLSPGDYHRFHSPADWTVTMRRHFPGTLFSVSPKIVKMLPTSLLTNERVAWYGRWKYGTFIMVAVAATNVGDIQTGFDADIATNNWGTVTETEKVYEKPLEFRRGDDFGHFNFGSTIVMIYEAPAGIEFGSNPSKRIKMGEALLHTEGLNSRGL